MTGAPTPAEDTPPTPPWVKEHPKTRRWTVVVMAALLVGLGVIGQRTQRLFSSDRVGSTHRVTLTHGLCGNDIKATLGDHVWESDGWPSEWPTPHSWMSSQDSKVEVEGTLHIDSLDSGTFTADQGGSVQMTRRSNPYFSDLSCAIR